MSWVCKCDFCAKILFENMAKKRDGRYENFIVYDPPEELRGWKYGIDNSKTMYDTHKGQRAAALKSPYAWYMLAVAAFMLFWFAYSLINAIISQNGAVVALRFVPSFFVFLVCGAIIGFSVFGLWGKFARWALKNNMTSGKPSDINRLQDEIDAADANKGRENALNIFEDYIEVINFGKRTVVNRGLLRKVLLRKERGYCTAEFVSIYGYSVCAYVDIPLYDVHKIKEIFGCMCEVERRRRRYAGIKTDIDTEAPPYYREKARLEIDGAQIGGLVMGLICAAAGGGIIAMHYYVNASIPMPLGLFFIAGGLLAMLTAFSGVTVVKVFAIPFVFGLLFAGFPFIFIFSVAQSEGTAVALPSLHGFLCSFSPVYAGLFFLAALGVLFMISAFVQLIKYLKSL